jgi:hypothetical protein
MLAVQRRKALHVVFVPRRKALHVVLVPRRKALHVVLVQRRKALLVAVLWGVVGSRHCRPMSMAGAWDMDDAIYWERVFMVAMIVSWSFYHVYVFWWGYAIMHKNNIMFGSVIDRSEDTNRNGGKASDDCAIEWDQVGGCCISSCSGRLSCMFPIGIGDRWCALVYGCGWWWVLVDILWCIFDRHLLLDQMACTLPL